MSTPIKLVLLGCLAFSVAGATTIAFTHYPTAQGSGTLNGFWTATVDGKTGVQLICDDYVHTSRTGVAYDSYQVSVLDGPNPLHNVRFSPPNQAQAYRAAAILVSQLLGLGAGATAQQVTNYQYALWDLFTPSVPTNTTQDNLRTAAWDQAGANPTLALYSQLRVYTPDRTVYPITVDGRQVNPQEFLGWAPVPEPSQFAGLLAVLGIGWFVRRRRMA